MEALTEHILAVARKNDIFITNLALQKVLYFTLRNSKNILSQEQLEEVYDEPFLVWRYGPILESQYQRFYSYGSGFILEDFEENESYQLLNDLILRYLKADPFRMVSSSQSHPFWRQNEEYIVNGRSYVAYPLEAVLRPNTTN